MQLLYLLALRKYLGSVPLTIEKYSICIALVAKSGWIQVKVALNSNKTVSTHTVCSPVSHQCLNTVWCCWQIWSGQLQIIMAMIDWTYLAKCMDIGKCSCCISYLCSSPSCSSDSYCGISHPWTTIQHHMGWATTEQGWKSWYILCQHFWTWWPVWEYEHTPEIS